MWTISGAEVGPDPVANPRRRASAHVGLYQDCKQLAEEGVIDQPAFALEQVANVGVEQSLVFLSADRSMPNKPASALPVQPRQSALPQRGPAHSPALPGRRVLFLKRSKTPMSDFRFQISDLPAHQSEI